MQRNELLSRPVARPPMIPMAQAFAIAEEATVKKELYDDPLTNENMFVNSSRLAEKITPKLPVTNFDYNDLESYDDEANRAQESLSRDAEAVAVKQQSPSLGKYQEVSNIYEAYINYLRNANARYGINEQPKARRSFNSQISVKREIRRIEDLILEKFPTSI